jgi:hypothetical protein
MSPSYFIQGVVSPDAKYKEMLQLYKLCNLNSITIPREVSEFFNWDEPNEKGFLIDIPRERKYGDLNSYYEVDLTKIPEKVKAIRFIICE